MGGTNVLMISFTVNIGYATKCSVTKRVCPIGPTDPCYLRLMLNCWPALLASHALIATRCLADVEFIRSAWIYLCPNSLWTSFHLPIWDTMYYIWFSNRFPLVNVITSRLSGVVPLYRPMSNLNQYSKRSLQVFGMSSANRQSCCSGFDISNDSCWNLHLWKYIISFCELVNHVSDIISLCRFHETCE